MTANRGREHINAALFVIAVALLLRILWALQIPVIPLSDGHAYDVQALTIAEHGVYGWTAQAPSAFWPVGTSAIYGAIYFLLGHTYTPIVVFNIAIGIAIVALTMWLANALFDRTIAVAAGALMAIWPSQIAFVTILASELLFTFFVMLSIAAWIHPRLSNVYRVLLCGLAIAAASYVRPVALLLPLVFWLSTAFPSWKNIIGQFPVFILTVVVIAVAVTPWSVRNTRLFGHFVLLSTNGGVNFWMGNNPQSNGGYMPEPAATDALNEYERDKVLGNEAMRFVMDKPAAFVLRTIRKAIDLHIGETIAVHWNADGIKKRLGESALYPLKGVTQGYWLGVLSLALVGFGAMIRQRGVMGTLMHPIVAVQLYFTAVYAVVVIQDRYHIPSHPFIAIMAAIGIQSIVGYFRSNTVRA